MNNIFYHGSNKLFDKFDLSFSLDGNMYFTPCILMAKHHAVGRTGTGYVYTVKIKKNLLINGCKCGSINNLDDINIIDVQLINEEIPPIYVAKCGKFILNSKNRK